ncbi:MAG: preprotein translocase subunit SecY [Acidilobaceae archaeon]
MGVIDILARASELLPSVEKPKQRPTLDRRLLMTGIVLVIYFILANIPLYGIPRVGDGVQQIHLLRIIFASSHGTLMELGIGPIVTAGLILQILVGAKLINLDLTNPEDRKKFTGAMKTLAIVFAVVQAVGLVASRTYWIGTGIVPSYPQMLIVMLQLVAGAILVILFDELLQKGWGIGSAISLFILAGVAHTVFWQIFGFVSTEGGIIYYGVIPALVTERSLTVLARPGGYPDVTGLLATILLLVILVYLQGTKIEIPVAVGRFAGLKSRVPLQLIYVTNIPILLVGIIVADLQLIEGIVSNLWPASPVSEALRTLIYYVSPPHGIIAAVSDPVRVVTFAVSWTIMAVALGFMWVEVSGLNPRSQAETLVKSGLEIPGVRRNVRVLEELLAEYIYPLTLLSSLIVVSIVILGDTLGCYGSATGLLLSAGIIQQYYAIIVRDRALEMYPVLRRLLGEE